MIPKEMPELLSSGCWLSRIISNTEVVVAAGDVVVVVLVDVRLIESMTVVRWRSVVVVALSAREVEKLNGAGR
jgi:hypothetical protein